MATSTAPTKAIIFSYQVGFGDCFLLRFVYPRGMFKHVLIDFGTTGLPEDIADNRMVEIANDIAEKCGESGLDAVIATHRHADHISGFATKTNGKGPGDIIRALEPKVVIQPWTEDPAAATNATVPTALSHPSLRSHALSLNTMHTTAANMLQQLEGRHRFSPAVEERIRFIGEDNLANKSAVKNLATMGSKKPVYTYHGGPTGLGQILPGVVTHVLGPPTLKQTDTIRKQRSRDPEEFWHFQAQRLSESTRRQETEDVLFPGFETTSGSKLPMSVRWFSHRLREARGDQMLQLVRILDKQMNNTSLILLFQTARKKLLFPGDAQLENWQYALSRKGIENLLADVDLYKVGHHGSLNATPKSMWKMLEKKGPKTAKNRLKTILSTMENKHGSSASNTEVPRRSLVNALKASSDLYSTQSLKASQLYQEIEIDL
jgi:L-ascorbate metabolism protein UlaG (beta-lactamase superfamily)